MKEVGAYASIHTHPHMSLYSTDTDFDQSPNSRKEKYRLAKPEGKVRLK